MQSGRYDLAVERWLVRGVPTVLVLDPRGRVLDRMEGVVPPEALLARLRSAELRAAVPRPPRKAGT